MNSVDKATEAVNLAEFNEIVSKTPGKFTDLPTILRLRVDGCTLSGDSGVDNNLQYAVYLTDKELCFTLDYPSIMLHAVSASTNSIFLQIDERTENVDEFESRDMHIHPPNASDLQKMYDNLSYCASLHQNKFPSDDQDEDNDGDAMLQGEDGAVDLSETGAANLARFDDMLDNQDKHADKRQKQ
ncbi:hypothetical protein E3P99_03354 [Wallemia hederae]|uniref:Uncharacterized protein n=1 Tax=Wallemia hederae TaxID=1540922 RepID=A0A4T0FG64_9BASI|nr:hypothetical protein E3P99_03354 [Wallemia hederae]